MAKNFIFPGPKHYKWFYPQKDDIEFIENHLADKFNGKRLNNNVIKQVVDTVNRMLEILFRDSKIQIAVIDMTAGNVDLSFYEVISYTDYISDFNQ